MSDSKKPLPYNEKTLPSDEEVIYSTLTDIDQIEVDELMKDGFTFYEALIELDLLD